MQSRGLVPDDAARSRSHAEGRLAAARPRLRRRREPDARGQGPRVDRRRSEVELHRRQLAERQRPRPICREDLGADRGRGLLHRSAAHRLSRAKAEHPDARLDVDPPGARRSRPRIPGLYRRSLPRTPDVRPDEDHLRVAGRLWHRRGRRLCVVRERDLSRDEGSGREPHVDGRVRRGRSRQRQRAALLHRRNRDGQGRRLVRRWKSGRPGHGWLPHPRAQDRGRLSTSG